MAAYDYKITDIDALQAAHPSAVVVTKIPNRVELGKLWRASKILGVGLPGVEADGGEVDELKDVPAHVAKAGDA